MSLTLYIDHNVHAGIVQGLRDRGIDCLTALQDGMAAAEDESILRRAAELGRVVVSQDVDFLAIATAWITEGRQFEGVIYARQRSITIGMAIRDIEIIVKVMDPSEMRNWIERVPLT